MKNVKLSKGGLGISNKLTGGVCGLRDARSGLALGIYAINMQFPVRDCV